MQEFKLKRSERAELKEILKRNRTEQIVVVQRAQSLLALDVGRTPREASKLYGLHRRTVERIRTRYASEGLGCLYEKKAPGKPKEFGAREEALIVSLACGPPPEGRARWSMVVLAAEAKKRKIVDDISRETVRLILSRHELKPWREKNVVRS